MELQGTLKKSSETKVAVPFKNVEIMVPISGGEQHSGTNSGGGKSTTASPISRSTHSHSNISRVASRTSGAASAASTPGQVSVQSTSSAKRIYRTAGDKWVTRDIAALDFMLGIPLIAEAEIVHTGWLLQKRKHESEDGAGNNSSDAAANEEYKYKRQESLEPPAHSKGRWWEKWVNAGEMSVHGQKIAEQEAELERPNVSEQGAAIATTNRSKRGVVLPTYAPGRRLEGDEAVRIQIPLTTDTVTKQKSIARLAALREWELKTAHGLSSDHPPMLDGRVFFSAAGSYPVSVFSLRRYEPKKEEAALRRQKLEARGGGGTQFILPVRDWRGISYRALLPRRMEKKEHFFNRFLSTDETNGEDTTAGSGENDDDNTSQSSNSSDESDEYVPGILDDPAMVLGRHRNVMIGDRVTGPIVSSTIQFVKPALLKADLNKQFRERFDGWEPPRSQIKFIGARVIDGVYTLTDPADEFDDRSCERRGRGRQGSVTSMSSVGDGPKEKILKMPPSLTLSKIRSVKHQALKAAVKAQLEIATVALACVYFERLCLDCRVDKSNRRLCFAACLLLASKLNEPNVGLVMQREEPSGEENINSLRKSLARPNKRSNTMFAVLLEFFTQDWSISIKHLFDAEWGVFAALGFSLHATPSQVSFHFKRLMKTLEWNPLEYLDSKMYAQWQDALSDEEERRKERERRRAFARLRKEERLLDLHLELENKVLGRRAAKDDHNGGVSNKNEDESPQQSPTKEEEKKKPSTKKGRMKLLSSLHRFGRPIRLTSSQNRLHETFQAITEPDGRSNNQGPNSQGTHRRTHSGGRIPDLGRIHQAFRSVTDHHPCRPTIPTSPSMPAIHAGTDILTDMGTVSVDGIVAIDIPEPAGGGSGASSVGSIEPDGLYV
jgi:hypothetical protein